MAAQFDFFVVVDVVGGGGGGGGGVVVLTDGWKSVAGRPTMLGLGPVFPLTAPSPGSELCIVSVDFV